MPSLGIFAIWFNINMKQLAKHSIFYTLHKANESVISVLSITEEKDNYFVLFCFLGPICDNFSQFYCCIQNILQNLVLILATFIIQCGKVALCPKLEKKTPTLWWILTELQLSERCWVPACSNRPQFLLGFDCAHSIFSKCCTGNL